MTSAVVVAVSVEEANQLLPGECSCAVHRPNGMHTNVVLRKGHSGRTDPVQSVLSLTAPVEDGCTIGLLVKMWSCNACGPHPQSTAGWCQSGCGRDYNTMTERWVLVGEVTVTALLDARTETGREFAARMLLPERFDPAYSFVAVLDPAKAVRYPTPQTDRPCPVTVEEGRGSCDFVGYVPQIEEERRMIHHTCGGTGRVPWSALPLHTPTPL